MTKASFVVAVFTFALFIYFSSPFFHPGFFPTFDDVQVVRINEMAKELRSGQFPVRYIDSFGNGGGYMLFNFYSPLAYYVGAAYEMIGVPPVKATKLVFLTGILIGALGIFFLLKKYTNLTTALLSLCLFFTSMYVGYDIFWRGALAEVWGFMFFPWILWGLLKVKDKPETANCLVAAIFYALGILSHIAITFAFSLFLFFIILIPPYKKKAILGFVLSIASGLLLSAFFWLPLLVEQRYIAYGQSSYATTDYLQAFLSFPQLLGIGIPKTITQPTLGLGLFLLTLISSLFLFSQKKNPHKRLFLYALGACVLSSFLTLSLTKPLWDRFVQLRYLQSPWRFLAVATFYAIFICGLALSFIKKFWIQTLIIAVLVAYTFIFQQRYLRPATYNYISQYKAEGACATTTWKNEYLPWWVYKCLAKKIEPPIFSNTASRITDLSVKNNGRLISFKTDGSRGTIAIAKYYFPSWQLQIDGKKTPIYPSPIYGLISFAVPQGEHVIQLTLGNTPVQTIGNLLSMFGIGIIFIFLLLQYGHERFKAARMG